MKSVEDVLLEIVGVCESLDLDYAIMGGLAVRVHGIPRPTYDVDFELSVTDQQMSSFFAASDDLGYEVAAPYRSGWRDTVGGMPLVKMATYVADVLFVQGQLDETYMHHWAAQLAITDRLKKALATSH